ncbi:MAG: Na+/H+ antiporter NhaC family protein [Lachnospiraceae bacterium]|nr:Na+/H+ antiporter NhaC family protein [Lachnospiraceae bacterium]
MYGTFWALVPPIVAILLALITKEVYSSLFVGILIGGLFYAGFAPEATVLHIFNDGFVSVLSDSWNVGILIFLVILGVLVSLMNKAGGSAAFGKFAGEKIKSKTGAQLATVLLGVLIFVDDYFNCLTVGSVMKPVTDKHKVSREKLAYLIDSTAAPVCIIAPISSWAAAVSGFVEGEDGFTLFLRAIPYNFYAIFTLFFVAMAVILKVEFGPMKAKEDAMQALQKKAAEAKESEKDGKVLDLIVPIFSLIVCCIIGMIYTGGFFEGANIIDAFSDSDASVGLMLGSFFALMITIIYYLLRRSMSLKECMECMPEGFKAMVPAILILTFAWTLKAMTDSLGAAEFVEGVMEGCAEGLMSFLPAVIFVVACLLAFASGTSWGTFGILIPIVVAVFQETDPTLMIISISACMAGAVCGDHCSPISDTTIMASAGADCEHVSHVSTQLPYAITVAVISFVVYIIAGFCKSALICLPIGMAMVLGLLLLVKMNDEKVAS